MKAKIVQSSHIVPVILSGGSGTRLWPLSRAARPKQFLPVQGDSSLLQQTLLRVKPEKKKTERAGFRASDPLVFAPPVIIASQHAVSLVEQQCKAAKVAPGAIIIEPEGKGTASAIIAAAQRLAQTDPNTVMVVLPSDHVVDNQKAFLAALAKAVVAAHNGAIVTLGAKPTAPDTGFGYIAQGEPWVKAGGTYAIRRFVEKPNAKAAQNFLAEGKYFWNCGIFIATAQHILQEAVHWCPDILKAVRASLKSATTKGAHVYLNKREFARVRLDSFDKAIMEHTKDAVVVPVDMGWSDVGSWATLWDVGAKDSGGNVAAGATHIIDSKNCLAYGMGGTVALIGVNDLVVVKVEDAVLVMPRSRAQDVKQLVAHIKPALR